MGRGGEGKGRGAEGGMVGKGDIWTWIFVQGSPEFLVTPLRRADFRRCRGGQVSGHAKRMPTYYRRGDADVRGRRYVAAQHELVILIG